MIDALETERDPGPLSDKQLRALLRDAKYVRASKTKDRVQDAFDRLIRERTTAEAVRDAATETLLEENKLMEELAEELAETRSARVFIFAAGIAIGALTPLVAHSFGLLW